MHQLEYDLQARDSACNFATKQAWNTLEDIYYASSIANVIGGKCKVSKLAGWLEALACVVLSLFSL